MNVVTRHDQDKPLFMLLSYTAPHTPLQAHQQDIDKYKNITDVNRRNFLAMVDAVDQGIGRFVDTCKIKGFVAQ
jgi:arylsulfatase A-like enzyme